MAAQAQPNSPTPATNGQLQATSSPTQLQKGVSVHSPLSDMSDSSQESASGGGKKSRTQFSPSQLLHLEKSFSKNPLPSSKEREQIANRLELTPKHIQVR